MEERNPGLRDKFLRFREVYERARVDLEVSGAAGKTITTAAWKTAQAAVPLTPGELHIYKMQVALYSVNGGELFAGPDRKE